MRRYARTRRPRRRCGLRSDASCAGLAPWNTRSSEILRMQAPLLGRRPAQHQWDALLASSNMSRVKFCLHIQQTCMCQGQTAMYFPLQENTCVPVSDILTCMNT